MTNTRPPEAPPRQAFDTVRRPPVTSFAARIPIKVVSEDLGHRDTRITENLYTSVLPN
jgi:hypothetical protein